MCWPFEQDPYGMGYINKMSRDRKYGDGVFLQVFANLYKKDIIIVPVDVEDAVNKEVG